MAADEEIGKHGRIVEQLDVLERARDAEYGGNCVISTSPKKMRPPLGW
jgi:hypothetical protein